MNRPLIVPIVEGHGEMEAVPLLIRRIFEGFLPGVIPAVNKPNRVKAGSFLNNNDYFKKYYSLSAAKAAQGNGMVLMLLDCEDNCPAELGPQLLGRARDIRADIRCSVVLARREYETWFLTAASSLRGCAGLPGDLDAPQNPESIRGAKEWFGKHTGFHYDPIIHQAKFTARFDIQQARTNRSFDRLIRILIGINPPSERRCGP